MAMDAERAASFLETPAPVAGVTLICGCMFSGKTTELLRRIAEVPAGGVQAFKHSCDRRYRSNAIVSHAAQTYPATPVTCPGEILDRLSAGSRLVALDEGHFFDDGLLSVVSALHARGLTVVIAALDRDSWGRPFPVIGRLRGCCSAVLERQGTCSRCGHPADRTQRLTPIVDGNLIGGPESFEPRCLTCWRPPSEPPPG